MTIEELRAVLRRAHAAMGEEGRLTFTLGQEPGEPCYIAHWVRPGESAYEDCRTVGLGSLAECLAALERYVLTYRPRPSVEEVGRMLGLDGDAEAAPWSVAAE